MLPSPTISSVYISTSSLVDDSTTTASIHYSMFDETITLLLETYCTGITKPQDNRQWYGVWTAMLSSMFPSADGYIVEPYICRERSKGGIPGCLEVLLLVKKLRKNPFIPMPVLVVRMVLEQAWINGGPQDILNQLDYDAQEAISYGQPVYWIAAVGHRWRYGIRKRDSDFLEPKIDWHMSLLDEMSNRHFKDVIRLVHSFDDGGNSSTSPAITKAKRKRNEYVNEKKRKRNP
jgi:hypothetical protein